MKESGSRAPKQMKKIEKKERKHRLVVNKTSGGDELVVTGGAKCYE